MNIIPIIAKADTISKSELHKFKIKIMSELVSNGVQIYQFPTDDEAVAEINSVMNVGNAASSIAAKSCDKLNCYTKIHLKGEFDWECPDTESVGKSNCESRRYQKLLHTELIKMWLMFSLGALWRNLAQEFIEFLKKTFFKINSICS